MPVPSNVVYGVFDRKDLKDRMDPKNASSATMEDMFKKCPSRYYYIEGKKAEVGTDYLSAADFYTAAYDAACREGLSCAVRYQWKAMQALEMEGIFQELKKEYTAQEGRGRMIDEDTIMMHYSLDDIIPAELFKKAKDKIPLGFPFNVLTWNKKTNTIKFIHALGFFTDNEPEINRVYTVFESGNVIPTLYNPDPELIFDKWMLTDGRYSSMDRKESIRRSVKIRYLQIQSELKKAAKYKSIWKKYVDPAVGNRNVGHLFQKFLKDTATA